MAADVEQREHPINRGLFQRSKIGGIEADAFVLLVLFDAGFFVPVLLNPKKMWWYAVLGVAVFASCYFLLRWLYKIDPRFFVKIRHFFKWSSFFRARPSLIAAAPASGKKRKR